MRMAGPDIVLFVVGAVLFGGATYAIVSLDGDLSGSSVGLFNVAWRASTVEVGAEDVASMRSASATFDVVEPRVTKVIITLACNDPVGATPLGFNLQIAVEGPNVTLDEAGACGSPVVLEVPMGELPPDLSVAGSTETEARENLPAPDSTPAVGTWTVTVNGARTGGAPGLPVGDPSGSITLEVEYAEAQLTAGTR